MLKDNDMYKNRVIYLMNGEYIDWYFIYGMV